MLIDTNAVKTLIRLIRIDEDYADDGALDELEHDLGVFEEEMAKLRASGYEK